MLVLESQDEMLYATTAGSTRLFDNHDVVFELYNVFSDNVGNIELETQ